MLLLWLACSGQPQATAPGSEAQLQQTPAPPEPTFDAWPQEPALLPKPSEIAALLQRHGLEPACLIHSKELSYKTQVSVDRIAAARIGAEIGALVIEASTQRPELLAQRATRIHAGLANMAPDSQASAQAAALVAFLEKQPDSQQVLVHLDAMHLTLLAGVEGESGSETLPVMLAGAWIQAYHLIAQAMIDGGDPAGAHAIFHRPEVGMYFSSYVAAAGSGAIPSGMLSPLQSSLDQLRISAAQDPMSIDDLRAIDESLADILGML